MDWLCRFGEPGCGIEEFFAIVGFIGSVVILTAGIVFARAYISAAGYAEPVVKALQSDVDRLSRQNVDQAAQMKAASSEVVHLRELVTQTAKVDAFRAEAEEWVTREREEHEALSHQQQKMTETQERMTETLGRMATSITIGTRTIVGLAKQMGVEVRADDY